MIDPPKILPSILLRSFPRYPGRTTKIFHISMDCRNRGCVENLSSIHTSARNSAISVAAGRLEMITSQSAKVQIWYSSGRSFNKYIRVFLSFNNLYIKRAMFSFKITNLNHDYLSKKHTNGIKCSWKREKI